MSKAPRLVVVLLLAGCVSAEHIPVTPASGDAIRGREVALGTRERPDFTAMTPGTAAFGLVSAAIWLSQGNSLVVNNNVEDPALSIARVLSEDLREIYGARVSTAAPLIPGDDVAQAARAAAGAELLLDIRTINWSLAYFPTSWGKYRVMYSARLRLIDVKRAQVLVEGRCVRLPEETPQSPSYDQLVANGAEGLKKELAAAAEFCIEQYRSASFLMAARKPAAIAALASAPAASAAAPVAAASPAVAIAASVPSMRAASANASPLPSKGDTWKYRAADSRAGAAAHEYVVRVKEAASGRIVDELSIDGGSWSEREHMSGAYLMSQGQSLFSPYLNVLGQMTGTDNVGISDPAACSPTMRCRLNARLIGKEEVVVAAGKFEATKVVFTHAWIPRVAAEGTRTVTVWYADEAKRAVKFSSRLQQGAQHFYINSDFDLELTEYQLK
jgi:hypothetical protein